MSAQTLGDLYNSEAVRDALVGSASQALSRRVSNLPIEFNTEEALSVLRVAAVTSLADIMSDRLPSVSATQEPTPEDRAASSDCFERWLGYFQALEDTGGRASLDEITGLAASGLLAERPHEVRSALRSEIQRVWLGSYEENLSTQPWHERVREGISIAVLHIVRQENHADIRSGSEALLTVAKDQKEIEAHWLEQRPNPEREAMTVLAYYHVAQATLNMAEFIDKGYFIAGEQQVRDPRADLQRLTTKAEDLLSAVNDQDALLWLSSAAQILEHLRSSSIWVQSRGISAKVDLLLEELAREGRPHPVFSLLPSQSAALRQALLDPSRMAIVLQMPTSAGKTLLAEFAIAQAFDAYRDSARVVYLAPTRALATQVRRQLSEDLTPLGVSVAVAGSAFEEDPFELNLLTHADGVVVATPEKLDLMLRAHADWFSRLRLVIVDEAHLLAAGERGAALELLLTNLRRQYPDARLLLLTPFMDNAAQIATWLSRERGHAISVHWRPSRVIMGAVSFSGSRKKWSLTIDWRDPYKIGTPLQDVVLPPQAKKSLLSSNMQRTMFVSSQFRSLGAVLALYSASPAQAEQAAAEYASTISPLEEHKLTPQLRLAIGLARHEFGPLSPLALALERGAAYHHSSLPPILRYLVEDQLRAGTIHFVAATSTLAQGMNFPVATVVVHSVHKPRGGGNYSPAEFWNVAGRAGRVGLSDRGVVVFADPDHRKHRDWYCDHIATTLTSALLAVLPEFDLSKTLKEQYRKIPALRPFIQYLAHAAVAESPAIALKNLEELIQQSLVSLQVKTPTDGRKLRKIAELYLSHLVHKTPALLSVADATGLAHFSFDELFAKIQNDPLLQTGPAEVLLRGENGFSHLIEALRWIPEFNLAIGYGEGEMDVGAVAAVVHGWVQGEPTFKLASAFLGDDAARVRHAGRYLYGTISQSLSWGAHAYLRGWVRSKNVTDLDSDAAMLPAYIQYGVRTPEAAVGSLLGVPRAFAESFASHYRNREGVLKPEETTKFRDYVRKASVADWTEVVSRSSVGGVEAADLRIVVRQMQGIAGSTS